MEKEIKKIISEYKNKRFKTIELEKKVKKIYYEKSITFEYSKFAEAINILEQEGKIKPNLSSEKNNMQPSLYKKYMKIDKTIEFIPATELIRFHPSMKMSFFKKNRKRYEESLPYIEEINDFLYKPDKEIITVNERSLELFDDEKFLSSENGKKLLSVIGVTLDVLYCEKTYEPFFYYDMGLNKIENVIIVENKDTFHSFKKLMSEGLNRWGGTDFQFLIYGEGNKITKSIDFADEIKIPREAKFYYFGDIDKEGVSIKGRLEQKTVRKIKWMEYFYKRCWQDGKNKNIKSRKKQNWNKKTTRNFVSMFDSVEQDEVYKFIEAGLFIPQEILNQRKLRRLSENVQSQGV